MLFPIIAFCSRHARKILLLRGVEQLQKTPFQLPARLADGLDLESGPADRFGIRPIPLPTGKWFPRTQLEEASWV